MNKMPLNAVRLNSVTLNIIGTSVRKKSDGGGGGDVPNGYETFEVTEGVFEVADGTFYAKI